MATKKTAKQKEKEAQRAKQNKDSAKKLSLSKSAKERDEDEEEEEEEDTSGVREEGTDLDEDEEVITQDEEDEYYELVTQDDVDKGRVDPVKADRRNAGTVDLDKLSDDEKKDTIGRRADPASRGQAEAEGKRAKKAGGDDVNDSPTQVRLLRRIGIGTRVGNWLWAEGVGQEGYVDDVFTVPYYVAVHLSTSGIAVPFDKSIPHFSSIRTNTRPITTKFLR